MALEGDDMTLPEAAPGQTLRSTGKGALLEIDVSHSYGSVQALKDIRLTVGRNEFLCIVGPSGCGKSTLARIMSGLQAPSSGQCLLRGEPISPKRHNVSMVFQEAGLWPWRNVQANVEVGMEVKGLPRGERAEKAQKLLEFVNLQGFEKHYPYQLSGGMKQRASIARAFVMESELVLMDEPFVALDAPTREEMQRELVRLWEHEQRTVIFVTHSLEEAIVLGDRIIVMSARPGEIQGELHVPLDRPRDPTDHRVADLRRELRAKMTGH